MAIKLGQHCYSYFTFKYGRFKTIVEYPAYHKTQILGAEKIKNVTKKGKITYKAVKKPARKKWSVQKALDILEKRGDVDSILQIVNTSKKDDLSDVITQLQSFKYLAYVDQSI